MTSLIHTHTHTHHPQCFPFTYHYQLSSTIPWLLFTPMIMALTFCSSLMTKSYNGQSVQLISISSLHLLCTITLQLFFTSVLPYFWCFGCFGCLGFSIVILYHIIMPINLLNPFWSFPLPFRYYFILFFSSN